MSLFFNYTLNGIANGMIYAALALALVLVYRATRIVNFAQGAAGMMTTFIASTLLARSVGYWWAAGVFWAGAVICGALIRGGTRLHQEAGQPEPLDEISGLF